MSQLEPINSLDDAFEEQQEEDPYRGRLTIFRVVIVIVFAVFIARLYDLQVVEGDYYRTRADNNRFRLIQVEAPRGVIYDRNRELLVRNRPSYTIGIIPADLPQEPAPVYRRLGELLKMDAVAVQQAAEAKRGDRFTLRPIQTNVEQDLAFIVEERHRELPGVHVVVQPIRDYVDGPMTAHIVGYTGLISAEQLARARAENGPTYREDDRVGQTGLERSNELDLRGSPGERRMEVDALGREVRSLGVTQPVPGDNLVLSVDLRLQRIMYDVLLRELPKHGVESAVAMDPRSGEVLALVHLPTYDNNWFSRGISEEELKSLMDDTRAPLVNGTVGSAYPVGNILEALTAAAALQEGVVQPDQKVQCTGQLIVPSPLDPSIGVRFVDTGSYGQQDVISALADNCRSFFWLAGGGEPDGKTNGLGPERLLSYARLFGLGEATGIALTGETDGFLGSAEWKRQSIGSEWYKGDTYLVSSGQEYVTASPIQVASLFSAIVNGGTLYRPQLVEQVENDQGQTVRTERATVIRELGLSSESLALIREGMKAATGTGTTQYGTAYSGMLRGSGLDQSGIAGLASTVEYARPSEHADPLTHGWFVGYTPVDQPSLVLVVFLRDGKGAEDAAPLGKEIITRYQQALQSPPASTNGSPSGQ